MKMTYKKGDDFGKYITKECEEIRKHLDTQSRIFRGYCKTCKENARFEIKRLYALAHDEAADFIPGMIQIQCPTCLEYMVLLVFLHKEYRDFSTEVYLYKVFPSQDQPHELPESVRNISENLSKSYKEAIKCWNAGAYMGASAMFRRCLQIFLREILQVRHPSNKLEEEIKEAERSGKLGMVSALNAELLQKIGNQSAHPPKQEPIAQVLGTDLVEAGDGYEMEEVADFTEEDAAELHRYLLEIIDEKFTIPEAIKQARQDVIDRRSIKLKRQVKEDNN